MEDTITSEPQQIRAFTSPKNNAINKIGRLSPRILHAVCLTIIEPQGGRKEKEHKKEKESERKRGKLVLIGYLNLLDINKAQPAERPALLYAGNMH